MGRSIRAWDDKTSSRRGCTSRGLVLQACEPPTTLAVQWLAHSVGNHSFVACCRWLRTIRASNIIHTYCIASYVTDSPRIHTIKAIFFDQPSFTCSNSSQTAAAAIGNRHVALLGNCCIHTPLWRLSPLYGRPAWGRNWRALSLKCPKACR